MEEKELTPQERWVLEQVEKGEVADLKEKFGEEEENRCLGAAFLEALLTDEITDDSGMFKPHRKGISIKNAVVKEPLDLGNAEVAHIVYLDSCVFEDTVNFRDARLQRHLFLDGCRFSGMADFHRVKVELNLFCNGSVFQGAVNFAAADIGGQFNAKRAQFQGQGQENKANFNSLKVGQHAFFDNAVFQGPVDFVGADIKGQFNACRTEFHSPAKLRFASLKVGQSAFFDGAVFKGPVGLNDAHLLDIMMGRKPIPALDLDRTRIDRTLEIASAEIGTVTARNLAVQGPATLEKVVFKDKADLRDASFQSLDLLQVTWPPEKQKVWLEGLAYQAISAGPNPEDWVALLAWVKGSRFNTQNYSQLEAYFSRCGHRDRADKVFITGKREGAKRLPWWKRWPTKIFWGGLAGYGRKPYLSLPWILLIIVLGALVFPLDFDAKGLEPLSSLKKMAIDYPWPTKFILSLDRFLPGVDLGVAKYWAPKNICFGSLIYWYVQKLLGWILVPIALAAIYTRIK